MADQFDVQITGIEEVCRALDGVPARIVKNCYAKALTAAAVPIVQALEPRIPVDTGDLRDHLVSVVQIHEGGKGGVLNVGFSKDSYKARFVEYGHSEVGHPDHKEEGRSNAHPFMRPAAAVSADAAIEAFTASMLESLESDI